MNKLKSAFESGRFTMACELLPPKDTDISGLLEKAEMLKNSADAFNLTDSTAAVESFMRNQP